VSGSNRQSASTPAHASAAATYSRRRRDRGTAISWQQRQRWQRWANITTTAIAEALKAGRRRGDARRFAAAHDPGTAATLTNLSRNLLGSPIDI